MSRNIPLLPAFVPGLAPKGESNETFFAEPAPAKTALAAPAALVADTGRAVAVIRFVRPASPAPSRPAGERTTLASLTSFSRGLEQAGRGPRHDSPSPGDVFFDGGERSLPPAPPAVAAAEFQGRLRAVSLVPSSAESLRQGLLEYLDVVREAVAAGQWESIRDEAQAKITGLIGMLEFLEKALSKDVTPCAKCVTKRSCAKVNGGKPCPGCLGAVAMSAKETTAYLRAARAAAERLKAPTMAALAGLESDVRREP